MPTDSNDNPKPSIEDTLLIELQRVDDQLTTIEMTHHERLQELGPELPAELRECRTRLGFVIEAARSHEP